MEDNRRNDNRGFGIGHMIARILVSAVVLAVVAFLTPGFTINSIWTLLIAAVVIGGIDYLIERIAGFDASPFGRGITGFIVSAAIIWVTRYIVPGFNVGIISAIIAALVIGVINAIIPGKSVL
jgi:putative membrane protein